MMATTKNDDKQFLTLAILPLLSFHQLQQEQEKQEL